MKKPKGKIGVFDSGFGGLAILKEISKIAQYSYVYMGDTARTPYGTRSTELIYEFTVQGVEFLFSQGCELIIVACNTASADALRRIQREYLPRAIPIDECSACLCQAAEEAITKTKNNRVGVLATEGAVRTGAFPRELRKLSPQDHHISTARPAPLCVC
jgi:glutamate racemase